MFYEILGLLIRQAATSIESLPLGPGLGARGERDLRRVLLLLSRAGAMWPGIFAALAEENRILRRTLEGARAALTTGSGTNGAALPEDEDPLALHDQLLRQLDDCVAALHAAGAEWSRNALRAVRSGLLEAAEVQRRLIETAAAG